VALSPVVIEKFPGLDLRADPGDSPGALEALNVTLEPGRVRTRAGAAQFVATTGLPVFAALNTRGTFASHLIVVTQGTPGNLYVTDVDGVILASSTIAVVGADGATGVAIGTPAFDYFYVTARVAPSVVKRWDGTVWTSPAGFPAGTQVLAHMQTDNRLVACVGSRANFSDPGAPETFGANNYVGLGIGDGEEIHGATWFNNQLFVFKRTKFFVFYGNGVDSTGEPVFNYRAVDTGIGMIRYSPQAVCTGGDGVYFVGNDGIYRTTGGPPVKVSAPLDPFFDGAYLGVTHPAWTGGLWDTAFPVRLLWNDGKLYVAVGAQLTGGGLFRCMFIYDSSLNAWAVDSRVTYALAPLPSGVGTPELGIVYGGAASGMLRPNSSLSTDAGVAFASRYRTSFDSFGARGRKRIRETILEGTGTPTVQWSQDWGAPQTGSAVALGTFPTPGTGRQRLAVRGRQFSLQVGASSGAWSLHRAQVNLQDSTAPAGVTAG
jgi:hypothetical protein